MNGRELWRSDGTEAGTTLIKDLNQGHIGSAAREITQAPGGWALLAASDGLGGVELWKTDGTSENTLRIQDIAPGTSSSNPAAFTVAGPGVFFVADDGAVGPELWVLDSGVLSDRLTSKARLPLVYR